MCPTCQVHVGINTTPKRYIFLDNVLDGALETKFPM